MKVIALCFLLSCFQFQEKALTRWVDNITKDIMDMEDLSKYSLDSIPADVKVNFFWATDIDDIQIQDSTFSFLIANGKGEFCTKLTFQFQMVDNEYYLLMGETSTSSIFNQEVDFIDPWIKEEKLCED